MPLNFGNAVMYVFPTVFRYITDLNIWAVNRQHTADIRIYRVGKSDSQKPFAVIYKLGRENDSQDFLKSVSLNIVIVFKTDRPYKLHSVYYPAKLTVIVHYIILSERK